MRILALDVGKSKSVAYQVNTRTGVCGFRTVLTRPAVLGRLFARSRPHRLVMEVGPMAGWIGDLARSSGVRQVEVANVAHEAWRWRNVKRKTDRDDAVKLADLSMSGRLPTVHVPAAATRQWRGLIGYRVKLVERRTAVKNRIRALLASAGETMPRGPSGWSQRTLAYLGALSGPLTEVGPQDLWRGELALELDALGRFEEQIGTVEARLETLAAGDRRVGQVQTIPGVGPRLAEHLVALIDDPHRFCSGREVSAYVGLVPRQYQSGETERHGRITRRGNRLARRLLVEVAWQAVRYNPRLRAIYERVHRGSRPRRKVAIVAVARHLAVMAWAMLRDGTTWQAGHGNVPTQAAAGSSR